MNADWAGKRGFFAFYLRKSVKSVQSASYCQGGVNDYLLTHYVLRFMRFKENNDGYDKSGSLICVG